MKPERRKRNEKCPLFASVAALARLVSAGALEYTMEVPGILPEGGGSACRATLTPL
jgi:hypothetical protein